MEDWRWEEAPVICAGGTEVVALADFATEVVELVTPPPTTDVALVPEEVRGAGAVLVFAGA